MPVAFRFCLSQPGRAAELARIKLSYARTSRVVRTMLQCSSRAFSMAQPVDRDHNEVRCMPGCHGKHPPQPAQPFCSAVNQTTRDELRVPDEGARPSGDHLRPSGGPTEQARHRRAMDAGCRPTQCSSCAPRELLRRAADGGGPAVPAFARCNSNARSPHSPACAECGLRASQAVR